MDKCRLHEIRKLIHVIYYTDELFYLVHKISCDQDNEALYMLHPFSIITY